MSAFFVGKETIDAVATLILMADGPRSLADLNKVAKSCWLMNAVALETRYNDENANDFLDVINAYEFKHTEGVGFAAMLKAANCFLYQCNEGDISEMKLFQKLTAITERYAATTLTDEYHAAPWGLCG